MKVIRELEINGCWELQLFIFSDDRGVFVKPWHTNDLKRLGLDFEVKEVFWSISKHGTIRGMHFQEPPHAHCKFVQCQQGRIMDVLLDLRKDSCTYGQSVSLTLSGDEANTVYIPEGIAHGFQSMSESSQVLYFTSKEHVPGSDCGILWNSFGYDWPLKPTQISEKDQQHPSLQDYISPF